METLSGPEPPCPSCTNISDDREAEGKRATAIGRLRPDIVLYDEQNPRAESISAIAQHDQSLRPDVLLIIGTSLTTHGVQRLIRDFSKVIHKRRAGKVVFVNLTEPAKSWDGVIDYWVEWDCDAWVEELVRRQPAIHCRNSERQVRDHVLGIDKPYLQGTRSIPRVLVDLTGKEQLDNKGQGSSPDNPVDLTL
jgi:NAD-dependent histone deacetylase SIR2